MDNPEQLLAFATPDRILAACEWWDHKQPSAGVGMLARVIRQGGLPPRSARDTMIDEQRRYGESIADWLTLHFPELCKVDAKIIECERQLHGDHAAAALERSTTPNPAAFVAVLRLHHRHGKGKLTIAEHGPEIRQAARDHLERALADYDRLAAIPAETAGSPA